MFWNLGCKNILFTCQRLTLQKFRTRMILAFVVLDRNLFNVLWMLSHFNLFKLKNKGLLIGDLESLTRTERISLKQNKLHASIMIEKIISKDCPLKNQIEHRLFKLTNVLLVLCRFWWPLTALEFTCAQRFSLCRYYRKRCCCWNFLSEIQKIILHFWWKNCHYDLFQYQYKQSVHQLK